MCFTVVFADVAEILVQTKLILSDLGLCWDRVSRGEAALCPLRFLVRASVAVDVSYLSHLLLAESDIGVRIF